MESENVLGTYEGDDHDEQAAPADLDGKDAVITEIGAPQPDPEKNIIFVGKDREPPLAFHGVFRAELPDAETQKAGFYHEHAGQIIAHRPRLYKRLKGKGDK